MLFSYHVGYFLIEKPIYVSSSLPHQSLQFWGLGLDFVVIQSSTNCRSYRCTGLIFDLQTATAINNLSGCQAVIPCCCNGLFQIQELIHEEEKNVLFYRNLKIFMLQMCEKHTHDFYLKGHDCKTPVQFSFIDGQNLNSEQDISVEKPQGEPSCSFSNVLISSMSGITEMAPNNIPYYTWQVTKHTYIMMNAKIMSTEKQN